MKCGTRSLAVLGALALSAMGLVPAAWANEASQSGSAQSGETGPGLVDTPIPDIQAVGEETIPRWRGPQSRLSAS